MVSLLLRKLFFSVQGTKDQELPENLMVLVRIRTQDLPRIVIQRLPLTDVKYGQALPPKSLMDTPTGTSKRSAESTISNVQIF